MAIWEQLADTPSVSDIVKIYEAGNEDGRMVAASNRVEWVRTLELLERWLPGAPARVLDIGGGPGRYAAWLTERGYTVTLLDPVPKHIRQARDRGVDAATGDARDLPFDDEAATRSLWPAPCTTCPLWSTGRPPWRRRCGAQRQVRS